jgi:Flp pilus assembly protein protease CpaA
MILALIFSSIYLSAVDIKTHKIRNKALLIIFTVFVVLSILQRTSIHPISALIALSIGLVGFCFGLGAGDVKLFSVLSFFFLPLEITKWSDLAQGFTWIATLIVIGHLIFRKPLADPIPLAPAICAAFIWCAR